jgi:hypothetical protein
MHDDRGGRFGWLVVLGLFWLAQLAYLVSPIDLVPDFVPGFGVADDALSLLISFLVTGVSVWRALPEGRRISGPTAVSETYEPLTRAELEELEAMSAGYARPEVR